MDTKKIDAEVVWWTAWVLILSTLCYLPMLLSKKGIYFPHIGLNLKYLFVLMPFAVSVFFTLKYSAAKKWLLTLFTAKIKLQATLSCAALAMIGLSFSIIYYLIADDKDLFTRSYPTALAVVINCAYLFVTALIEEIAWRGFLLNKTVAAKGKKTALIYVGIFWAIWHIPMWTIRNSLDFREVIIYFIWTILISFILGMLFLKYKSILIVSLSHMIFNTCFITPVKYNAILLGSILFLIFLFKKIDTIDTSR